MTVDFSRMIEDLREQPAPRSRALAEERPPAAEQSTMLAECRRPSEFQQLLEGTAPSRQKPQAEFSIQPLWQCQ